MIRSEINEILRLAYRLMAALCAYPQDLDVQHMETAATLTINARAHAADKPKLIGPSGRNHRAIGWILKLVGARKGKYVSFSKILDAVVGEEEKAGFDLRDDWSKAEVICLIKDCAEACFWRPNVLITHDDEKHTTVAEIVTDTAFSTDEISQGFSDLFWSIGRSKGRILNVVVMRSPEASQPATAAGRHSGEVER